MSFSKILHKGNMKVTDELILYRNVAAVEVKMLEGKLARPGAKEEWD